MDFKGKIKNTTEKEENLFLEEVKNKLKKAYQELDSRVKNYAKDIALQKNYIWESRAEMDHAEKISARQSALLTTLSGEAVAATKNRIAKLIQSPYFGRFDFFRSDNNEEPVCIYVGIYSFTDKQKSIIFDWRAPISTMFYDFELGKARYLSPSGTIEGQILLKRQFRIREGKMEFMLESGLNIQDDVLQEELSRTSDERMKNIVATIQRDQNAIIRNEDAQVLIIQGVAGSGKTSIALHRIAFLLYRFKETLTSQDILIISPNKVFADFISNVLPELGEEQIAEKEMEGLANDLLEGKVKFQTFFEQVSDLLEKNDEKMQHRIKAKASIEFLDSLNKYVEYVENNRVAAEEISINGRLIPKWFIEEAFKKRPGFVLSERLAWVVQYLEHNIWVQYKYEITSKQRAELKTQLKKMCKNSTLRSLYKEFFVWLCKPELFKPKGDVMEYCDVFPLIYLKIRLEGVPGHFKKIKHLVIDEMQDYTPVQYTVISRLFSCDKTILGDVDQSQNPWSSSDSETINNVFKDAECVKLCKSYRSSYEITSFAQEISASKDLEAIQRHGQKPVIKSCKSKQDEQRLILNSIEEFKQSSHHTMAIICKTQKQARDLHKSLSKEVLDIELLTPQSTAFLQGILLCSTFLAKGLEFDQVHVVDASEQNYKTLMDKNLLYIAVTRAMHTLTLTFLGERTQFIPDNSTAVFE